MAAAAVVGLGALVGAGFVGAQLAEDDPVATRAPLDTTAPIGTDTTTQPGAEPVADVAAAVAPAVVQLETGSGLGSGVIYDATGLIITAAHVVQGEDDVIVRVADGTVLEGEVVGTDPGTDIAVVRVEPDGSLPVARLALGEPLRVGQLAVAIGSPFGLDQTVTSGVVSAIDRAMPTLDGAIGMIQTDAPINPGNSGGALADRTGRVIGINDQIQTQSGGNVGLGFAIPIDTAAQVADAIVEGREVEHAFLGVRSSPAAGAEAGALVVQVEPGSPADDAGLEQGDIVVALDGNPVASATDLVARVRSAQPGDVVTLTVSRNDSTEEITVTLGTA